MKKEKRYALISVYDKAGLGAFAKELKKLNFEIISSGGTAKFLRKQKIKVTEVEKLTKYPAYVRRPGQDAAPDDPRRHPGRPDQ